jgi:predicted RNase H-like HicB family nuclease
MSNALSIRLTLHFLVEPDEGAFHAYSPALKGLHVDGASEDEAVKNFVEAASGYLMSVLKHGEPLPIGLIINVPQRAHSHIEEILVPWVPPSLLTSGASSRA